MPKHKNFLALAASGGTFFWVAGKFMSVFVGTLPPFQKKIATPAKINMESKIGGLEGDFPFQRGDSQVPCLFWDYHLPRI